MKNVKVLGLFQYNIVNTMSKTKQIENDVLNVNKRQSNILLTFFKQTKAV